MVFPCVFIFLHNLSLLVEKHRVGLYIPKYFLRKGSAENFTRCLLIDFSLRFASTWNSIDNRSRFFFHGLYSDKA